MTWFLAAYALSMFLTYGLGCHYLGLVQGAVLAVAAPQDV